MTTTRCTFGALRADDLGHADDECPIVLLHGLTFDRTIWAPVIDAVQSRDPGRRIVALDLPGHGDSPSCPPHDLPHVAEVVHEALDAAGAAQPLLVGHSMSGVLATLYAGRFPTAGVVNVDQPPFVADFAHFVRSLEPDLRGAGFADVWRGVFAASFGTESLPDAARELVARGSRPQQDLVLGYWQMLLDEPADEIEAKVEAALTQVGEQGVPYLLLVGGGLDAARRGKLQQYVPELRVVEWPGTGHFPHLARPTEFAGLLAELVDARRVSRRPVT